VASKEVSVDVLTPQSSWTVGGAMAAAAAKVHEGVGRSQGIIRFDLRLYSCQINKSDTVIIFSSETQYWSNKVEKPEVTKIDKSL
jgi:hypothetical protein